MPCNVDPVYYIEKCKGKELVVTKNGQVLHCEITDKPYKASGIGYVPHWATCTAADRFRKHASTEENPEQMKLF